MVPFPPVPRILKSLAHPLKLADDHDEKDIVVAYWARMSALLLAIRLVPGKKSAQVADLIRALHGWLEKTKNANLDNEGITSKTTAQTLIQEYALRLFEHGNQQDMAEIYNKDTVKSFYAAVICIDVLEQFGISNDLRQKRKYAKWKAAYMHACLKAGELPFPGPPRGINDTCGIVHNSTLSEEELSTYTQYTGPLPFAVEDKPESKPDDNFPQASTSSGSMPIVSKSYKAVTSAPITIITPPASDHGAESPITPEIIQKIEKYCKFATSALTGHDIKGATESLRKALKSLEKIGKE